MRKRLLIVLIALLFSFGFLAGCSNSENSILALGVKNLPTTKYEVGQYPDIKGAQLAIVFENEPEEVKVFDLTWDMIDAHSYDISTVGTKNIVVNYVFEGVSYSTTFTVEYSQNEYKTAAIKEIEDYKATAVYSNDKKPLVDAYRALGVVNVKLSETAEEASSVVTNYKAKINSIPTLAEETAANADSTTLANAKTKALETVANYKLKDAAGEVVVYPELYAQIIESSRTIASFEIKSSKSVDDVNIAVAYGKANIDNAVLGYKTLDDINLSKIAATAAAEAAEIAKGQAESYASAAKEMKEKAAEAELAAKEALTKAEKAKADAEVAKVAAAQAQAKAEEAKTVVAKNSADAETAKINAEKAKVDAEKAKAAAEVAQGKAEAAEAEVIRIQNEIGATQTEINAAKAACEAAKVNAEAAKANAETAQSKAELASASAIVAKDAAETAQARAEEAKAAVELSKAAVDSAIASYNVVKAEYEAIKATVEANKAAAETAQNKAELALADSIVAKNAAVAAKEAADLILQQVQAAVAKLPSATAGIEEINNYVADANYNGINLLLVKNLKSSYAANLRDATTDAEVADVIAKAKAALDGVKTSAQVAIDEAAIVAAEVVQAKLEAKAILTDYVNNPAYIRPDDTLPINVDEQALMDIIADMITNAELAIDAATTVLDVEKALADVEGKLALETIYADYYSSELVKSLGMVFRNDYVKKVNSYSNANYELLLQIKDYYDNLIGRLDKVDQLTAKYNEALTKLAEVPTQSGQIANMILAVTKPIRIAVNTGDFDSMTDELTPIATEIVNFNIYTTPLFEYELRHYEDPTDPTKEIDLLAMYDAYCVRYNGLHGGAPADEVNGLVDAKVDANTLTTGVIAVIDALPAKADLVLANKAAVENARTVYNAWVKKYFTDEGYPEVGFPEDDNLAIVTNYDKLTEAETRIAQLVNAETAATTPATGVIALINKVVADYGYVALDCETLINDAREAYDAWLDLYEINTPNVGIVTNAANLPVYEDRLQVLKNAKTNAETADTGIIALIDVILGTDEYVTLVDKDQIEAAETEYTAWATTYSVDRLAEPENGKIVSNYAELTAARARYNKLVEAKAAADTPLTGVIAMITSLPLVDDITLTDETTVNTVRSAYDLWIKTYFTDEGFVAADEPINTDMINNYAELVEIEERIAELKLARTAAADVDALIEATDDENGYIVLGSEDEIVDAREAFTEWAANYHIENNNEYLVTKLADLVADEARLQELKNAKTNAETENTGIIDLIDVILADGEYIDLTIDANDLNQIIAAEGAYTTWATTYNVNRTIEPVNGAIVTNYAELTAARARYDKLVEAKTNAEATGGVIELISAVPYVVAPPAVQLPATLDSADEILAARTAYDLWIKTYFTDENFVAADEPNNTAIISNYADLTDAEEYYADLLEAKKVVDDDIAAIGTVTLSSETAINAAEEAYIELTHLNSGVSPQTHIAEYTKMTDARAKYETLLFREFRENTSTEVLNERIRILDIMGANRSLDDLAAVTGAAYARSGAITLVSAPLPPSPFVLGAWDRTVYDTTINDLKALAFNDMLIGARYLITTDPDTNEVTLTVYAENHDEYGANVPFTGLVDANGNVITEFDQLVISPLLGTGHVEFSGITVNGVVVVSGGGPGSVIFENCILNDVEVKYSNVKVGFAANTTAKKIIVDEGLAKATLEFNGQNTVLQTKSSIDIIGTNAERVNITFENPNLNLNTTLTLPEFNTPENGSVTINELTIQEDDPVMIINGLILIKEGVITRDEGLTGGTDLTFDNSFSSLVSFGGEGQVIEWYPEDLTLGRAAGHRIGVKIYAPSAIKTVADLTGFSLDIAGAIYDITALDSTADGNIYFYWYPLVTEPTDSFTCTIQWNDKIVPMSYYISIKEGTLLAAGNDVFKPQTTSDVTQVSKNEVKVNATSPIDRSMNFVVDLPSWVATLDGAKLVVNGEEKTIDSNSVDTRKITFTVDFAEGVNSYPIELKFNSFSETCKYFVTLADGVEFKVEPVAIEKDATGGSSLTAVINNTEITYGGPDQVIEWYPEDLSLGRTAGHRVGVIIKAPLWVSTTEGANVKYTAGAAEPQLFGAEAFDSVEVGNIYFILYPRLIKGVNQYMVEVQWNKYVEKVTYIINIADGTQYAMPPQELSHDADKTGGDLTVVAENNAITFGAAEEEISYYPNNFVDGYVAGHYVAVNVKTDKAAFIDDGFVLTVGGKTYTKEQATITGEYVVTVYVLVNNEIIENGTTFSIKWNADTTPVTYEVKFAKDVILAVSAGVLSEDDAKTAGANATATVVGDTITFTGSIKFYAENEISEGSAAGHYVGIKIVPDALTGKLPVEEKYLVTPENVVLGFSKKITWIENGKEFTYYVVIDKNIVLENEKSKVSKIELEYEGLSVVVVNNTIAVGAKDEVIPWFVALESAGRVAGHRIGIRIVPNANTIVDENATITTIDGRNVKFYEEFLTTGNGLNYFPLVTPDCLVYKFSVKWNAYSPVEIYNISIDFGTIFETPAVLELTVVGSEEVVLGNTATYTVEVSPVLASKDVVWSVDDETVATIDKEGVLTVLKAGTVVVKAEAANGVSDTISVKVVYPEITGVTVTGKSTLKVGEEATYTAKVLPDLALQDIVWTVDDDTVATIDKNGVLTAIKAGKVVVKATTNDTDINSIITVTIENYTVTELVTLASKDTNKVSVDAVVIGLQYNGYWISDGTKNILVYTGSAQGLPEVGSSINVTGNLSCYNNGNRFAPQISNSTFVALTDTLTVDVKSVRFDLSDSYALGIDSFEEAKASDLFGKLITIEGMLTGSGYNWKVTDAAGNEFIISNTFSTTGLIANRRVKMNVIVREVVYLNSGNFKASGLGGCFFQDTDVEYLAPTTILVKDGLAADEEFVSDGYLYKQGVSAFATLDEALAAVKNGQKIVYTEGTTIHTLTIVYKLVPVSFGANIWTAGVSASGVLLQSGSGLYWDAVALENTEGVFTVKSTIASGVSKTGYTDNAYRLTWHSDSGLAGLADTHIAAGQKVLCKGVDWEAKTLGTNPVLYFYTEETETIEVSTETWTLVTKVSDLVAGDKIVIAASEYDFAISTTQNGNNRGQSAITKSDSNMTKGEDTLVITLEAGNIDGTFAFKVDDGYLYAASSSKNYLRTETTLSDNSSWLITITDGVMSIVAQGTNTRNVLKYNQSSTLFACYGSGQKDICIYKLSK